MHARLLAAMLTGIDQATRDLEQVSQVIEQVLGPYEEQLAQAGSDARWRRRRRLIPG